MIPAPVVAVVIPLRNESTGLSSLLDTLLQQLPSVGEIIAVDTGSCDDTVAIVTSLMVGEERLRLVHAPGAFPGAARNAGIAATTAAIIVQVDGGCMIEPGWIEALYGPVRDGAADYVTGAISPLAAPSRLMGFDYDAASLFFSFMAWSPRSEKNMAGGAAVAYRREIWERNGGQPDWLRATEDVLFAEKTRMKQIRHLFAATPPCRWQAGPRMRDVLRRRMRYVRADLLLPRPGPSVRFCAIRTIALLAPLTVIGIFPAASLMCAGMAIFFWVRLWFKTLRRYAAYSPYDSLRLPVPLATGILLIGSAAWLVAEEAGFVCGLFLRFSRPSIVQRAHAYLKSPSGAVQ